MTSLASWARSQNTTIGLPGLPVIGISGLTAHDTRPRNPTRTEIRPTDMTRPMRRSAGRLSGGSALAGLVLAGAVLAGAVLSGCGSSTATGIPASSATEGASIAAPTTGPVPVSLGSLTGPLQPPGPIA